MNKALKTDIRELIFIRDLQPEEQRGSAAGLADAIIALLQPRMLSKDEVELIHQMLRLENVQMNLGDWASFDTLFDKVAKLKLIQEEDSE